LADGNTEITTPTSAVSNRWGSAFGAEGIGYLAPVLNVQEFIIWKETDIPDRADLITSTEQYYTF
jgi:hypothetical protein